MLPNTLCQHSLGDYSRGWLAVPRCKDVAGTPATLASEEAGVKTLPLSRGWRGFEALLLLTIKTSSGELPFSLPCRVGLGVQLCQAT